MDLISEKIVATIMELLYVFETTESKKVRNEVLEKIKQLKQQLV